MTQPGNAHHGMGASAALLWGGAGLLVGVFYLGYYCAKFFLLP